jgi:glycine cleavage system transcriptional repressor
MEKLLAVTAIGADRAGLVRDLSDAVTGAGCNIQESRMIALGSEFATLMLVSGNWHAIGKARERLDRLQRESGLTISLRDAEQRRRDDAAPYLIDVVTLDHEGIILGLSGFFAKRGLEIAELNTRRYNAPHTGATMFSVHMTVNIPADVHTGTLREEFMEYCDTENLDAVFEPAQR